MSQRLERVNKLLRNALSSIFARNFEFRNVLLTIHRVEASNDLRNAKVFIGRVGDENFDFLSTLKKARSFIQSQIPKYITLKRTPVLRFYLDTSIIMQNKMNQIIEDLPLSEKREED